MTISCIKKKVIDITMNSAPLQKILKENVWLSIHTLKLDHTWCLQQDKFKFNALLQFLLPGTAR